MSAIKKKQEWFTEYYYAHMHLGILQTMAHEPLMVCVILPDSP
jgi:hypothetical protein